MKAKILVVDDEKSIIELLTMSLEREGYEVVSAQDGERAVKTAVKERPDLIVLDVMLPDMDGFEVLGKLRKDISAPVIMLTARAEDIDKILGLELGADDYITKPFNPRELIARIKAILRRVRQTPKDEEQEASDEPINIGDLVVDLKQCSVTKKGKPINLTAKEFSLLELFLRRPNQIFTRQVVLEQVWGYDFYGESRIVDVHLQRLRKKIEKDPANPTIIETIRGMGYRFKGK